jgi:hypothetical protein
MVTVVSLLSPSFQFPRKLLSIYLRCQANTVMMIGFHTRCSSTRVCFLLFGYLTTLSVTRPYRVGGDSERGGVGGMAAGREN